MNYLLTCQYRQHHREDTKISHNIKLSGVKFNDLVALGHVIHDVSKGEAQLDSTSRKFRTYRGQPSACDATIKLPGNYDIGLMRHAEGHYEPIMESALMWQGSVLGVRGAPLGLVQQEFALREAEYEAAQRGYAAVRESGDNGRITLRMSVPD